MDTRKYLLKSNEIGHMEEEEKIHFLNPNAVRVIKSLGDAIGLNHIGVHIIYVEPGRDTTEYHKHRYEEECFYVLSGKGSAIIGSDSYTIEKGDFLGFPRNEVSHNIKNDGTETLICLVMGQRLSQDVTDYPNVGKRLYRNSGIRDLVNMSDIELKSATLPSAKG